MQEALTNVARHAQVTTVTARLWPGPDTLGIQVEAHRRDFDPQACPASSSGLAWMRERAMALRGELPIDSAPAPKS
jgi:signal transduction histidine kinase